MTIKLVSWNIRQGGGSRADSICKALVELRPDIVTLQEYRRNNAGELISQGMLKAGLGHQFIAETGQTKDNTIFIASRFPLQAGNFMGEEAVVDIVEASIELPEKELILLATHFPQKKAQIPLFNALLDDSEGLLRESSIIIGDLNCGIPFEDSDSKTFYATRQFQALLASGWVDAWRSRNQKAREFSWKSVRSGNRFRYDHCLASDHADHLISKVSYDHSVREQNISDHSMLWLELRNK